uniref:Uncharacterized protein n=1 Tax=Proboscia inermis TaxID=420281 RepID=A0A7S0BW27_9STRA
MNRCYNSRSDCHDDNIILLSGIQFGEDMPGYADGSKVDLRVVEKDGRVRSRYDCVEDEFGKFEFDVKRGDIRLCGWTTCNFGGNCSCYLRRSHKLRVPFMDGTNGEFASCCDIQQKIILMLMMHKDKKNLWSKIIPNDIRLRCLSYLEVVRFAEDWVVKVPKSLQQRKRKPHKRRKLS